MPRALLAIAAGIAVCSSIPRVLHAQVRHQVILGTVRGDSMPAVARADVAITMGPTRTVRTATTDDAGRFSLAFDSATGDYLVHINALGWKPYRERITRPGVDTIVLSVRLEPAPIALKGVQAQAGDARPQRGREPAVEDGSAEKLADGVLAAVRPEDAGILGAVAATAAGMLRTGEGISALGLPPSQTHATLNGMAFDGTLLPRDARTRVRTTTASMDPARGGFGAAQIAVELVPGSLFGYKRSHLSSDLWPMGRPEPLVGAVGGARRRLGLSLGGDGELRPGSLYYNSAVEAEHTDLPGATVLSLSPTAWADFGISADSVRRVLDRLEAAGMPVRASVPDGFTRDRAALVAQIDHTPRATTSWSLVVHGEYSRSRGLSTTPFPTPAASFEEVGARGSVAGAVSRYFGERVLSESKSSLSYASTTRSAQVPGPRVLLLFPPLSPDVGRDLVLTLGGGGALAPHQRRLTWETIEELQARVLPAHIGKLYFASRLDAAADRSVADPGTYTFGSPLDLALGQPASYARTLSPWSAAAREWSLAIGLSDQWKPSPRLRVLTGVRGEANRFLSRPAFDPDVLAGFGARTDHAPDRLHVSPRLGFTWVYGGTRNNAASYRASGFASRYESPSGALRGGIGEFRDYVSPAVLLAPSSSVGSDPIRTLQCLGEAVPSPDWSAPAGRLPVGCGATGADTLRSVEFLSRSFAPARSWRANLSWASRWKAVGIALDAIYSLNLDQPVLSNRNVPALATGTIPSEAERPLFADPTTLAVTTPALLGSATAARSAFARVLERGSGFRSHSAQLSLTLTPDLNFSRYFASATYTLGRARSEANGFTATTFGSPFAVFHAPAPFDVRHQLMLQLGWGRPTRYDVTLFARFASGLPFTPIVGGDVNGDGFVNDRAFLFDPARVTDPAFAAGLRTLIGGASGGCLARHLGGAVPPGACRTPWSSDVNARLALTGSVLHLSRRATVSLNLLNIAAGFDQALHGSRHLRGWGSPSGLDPVLYYPRAFDVAARRFTYGLNSHFGQPSSTAGFAGFKMTIDVSVDLGVSIGLQQFRRFARAGRNGFPGPRMSEQELKERYARNVPDPYNLVLAEADSLMLTPEQVDSLMEARSAYRLKIDALWSDLAHFIDNLPDRYPEDAAMQRQEATITRAWEVTRLDAPALRRILSALQLQMVPGMVALVVNAREPISIRVYVP